MPFVTSQWDDNRKNIFFLANEAAGAEKLKSIFSPRGTFNNRLICRAACLNFIKHVYVKFSQIINSEVNCLIK